MEELKLILELGANAGDAAVLLAVSWALKTIIPGMLTVGFLIYAISKVTAMVVTIHKTKDKYWDLWEAIMHYSKEGEILSSDHTDALLRVQELHSKQKEF